MIQTASSPPTRGGLDAWVDEKFQPLAEGLSDVVFFEVTLLGQPVQVVVLWLIVAALWFTISFRFINLRGFAEGVRLVTGRGTRIPGEDKALVQPGQVSHFQALATAVSGTVGVGNIAHVAIAVSVGGPGAIFWMVMAGFLGMSSKFVECTLGVVYRVEDDDGQVLGGPMFYLSRGLRERGLPRLGSSLAMYYAFCVMIGSLGIGCMFQANQAYAQFNDITGGAEGPLAERGWLFGVVLALIVAVVIVGGIQSIARVTSKLVPGMALTYLLCAWFVIASDIERVPAALAAIVAGAFEPEGFAGGMLGVMTLGFLRAAFSNEAGIGSASIAHAAVRTREPVTEGFVAILEPFIDTVVVCATTGMVIVVSGVKRPGVSGVELTSDAFAQVVPWFPVVLALVVALFAFSTIISWSYYGLAGWLYILGRGRRTDDAGNVTTEGPRPRGLAAQSFNLLFCVFVALGCMTSLDNLLDFSDAMVFAMAFANVLGLYLLAPVVRAELADYWAKRG